jgi:hypothetical protein
MYFLLKNSNICDIKLLYYETTFQDEGSDTSLDIIKVAMFFLNSWLDLIKFDLLKNQIYSLQSEISV